MRLGLSSLTPVACSPLPIFDDIADIAHRLPGFTPRDLALGLKTLLTDDAELSRFAERQQVAAVAHAWPSVSRQLDGLIRGEFVNDLLRPSEKFGERREI